LSHRRFDRLGAMAGHDDETISADRTRTVENVLQ
jgi:hypothetical protein